MEFTRSHSQHPAIGGVGGENVAENDEHLQQLAHEGAATGNLSLLMDAVSHDPSVLECQDDKGMTPLSHAVLNKQIDMVKLLVRMGARINTQDAMGRTTLCLAAYEGWYQGVVYLLRSGAKQSIPDRNGRLPLHASTHDTDSKTLSALLQTLSIRDINKTDNDCMTALHWAAFHNRPEHVQLLMLRGAGIYVTDVDEKTPLHWASQNGCLACCSIMAKCRSGGAPLINTVEGSGKTCVHLAAAAGYSEILEEFTDVPGVDFEALDPDDRTPLHWASVSGQEDCVKFLLDLGVMHSPRDINNCTPLDYAKQAGKLQCLKELLKTGAEYGATQSTAEQVNEIPKDDSSRRNSGQGTRKKRFGFLSGIFSRTKSGLKSKQSSLESNEDIGSKSRQSSIESNEENGMVVKLKEGAEMRMKKSVSNELQEKKPAICESGNAKDYVGSCDDELNEDQIKQLGEKNQTVCKSSPCHSSVIGAVFDSNASHLEQCSSSHESKECDYANSRVSRARNSFSMSRSASTPPELVSLIAKTDNSLVPERIPSFSHHSLLPSPSMSPHTPQHKPSLSASCKNTGVLGGYGDTKMAEEPVMGLKPLLCREFPDADTVQRHAQEILDAQRGLMVRKEESEQLTATRNLSHMGMVINPKLAPLSPNILGRPRFHTASLDYVSTGFQSGHSTESLNFETGAEATGQSPGAESTGMRSNRFDVLDPINVQQRGKTKKKKKRPKTLERKLAIDDLYMEDTGAETVNHKTANRRATSEQSISPHQSIGTAPAALCR